MSKASKIFEEKLGINLTQTHSYVSATMHVCIRVLAMTSPCGYVYTC